MTKRRRLAVALCITVLLLPLVLVSAQESSYRVDWQTLTLELSISGNLPTRGRNLPAAEHQTENELRARIPSLFMAAMEPLQIDSTGTFRQLLNQDTGLEIMAASLHKQGIVSVPAVSRDLRSMSLTVTWPLNKVLVPLFARHQSPHSLPPRLLWVPGSKVSGVVIYATGELPHYGEDRRARLLPCIFPELMAADGSEVLLRSMVEPDWLAKWGTAGYITPADALNLSAFSERIGPAPLRLIARGVYGMYPTDVVLALDDAARLLYLPENRKILAEGRVLIILDQQPPTPARR